jgi:hypothetical protein
MPTPKLTVEEIGDRWEPSLAEPAEWSVARSASSLKVNPT